MYTSILVAVDSSPSSRQALRHAVELARLSGATLTLLNVAAVVPPLAFEGNAPIDVQGLDRDLRQMATEILAEAQAGLPDGLSATTVARQGSAGEEIVAQIEEGEHDLVVLGSRGRGRIASGLLGSVVGDVHFGARVPMLIVHPDETAEADAS